MPADPDPNLARCPHCGKPLRWPPDCCEAARREYAAEYDLARRIAAAQEAADGVPRTVVGPDPDPPEPGLTVPSDQWFAGEADPDPGPELARAWTPEPACRRCEGSRWVPCDEPGCIDGLVDFEPCDVCCGEGVVPCVACEGGDPAGEV